MSEKQFSVFGSKGGQISPLMHIPLSIFQLVSEAEQARLSLTLLQTRKIGSLVMRPICDMLVCLGSIGMDHVISKPCVKRSAQLMG